MFVLKGYKLNVCRDLKDEQGLLDELEIDSGYINAEPYELPIIVPNVLVKIYRCPKECSLEEAKHALIDKYFGYMDISTQDYGYSEYTVEGFDVLECKIGEHDLNDLLQDDQNRFIILTIEKIK
jgi:hypothetical protein